VKRIIIYCTIIQITFLIVSDVSATYTAAIIKDVLQLQKIYSYNNFILLQNDVRVFVRLFILFLNIDDHKKNLNFVQQFKNLNVFVKFHKLQSFKRSSNSVCQCFTYTTLFLFRNIMLIVT
jgi:hypothetical protein